MMLRCALQFGECPVPLCFPLAIEQRQAGSELCFQSNDRSIQLAEVVGLFLFQRCTAIPPGNFAEPPALVASEAPLLDDPSDEGEEAGS